MKPLLAAAPAVFLLGSCMLGPDFKLPTASGGNGWKETADVAADRLPDDWWKLFRDSSEQPARPQTRPWKWCRGCS